MGITDYGDTVGGNTSYETTSFLAAASITTLSTFDSAGSDMTFQLNVNLGFENDGTWYVYWIQDVAWVDTESSLIYEVENNIWNFSGPGATMYSSTVSGNGGIYSPGYYAYGVETSMTYPGTFEMMVNSTVNSLDQPAVQFMYDDGSGFVTYDLVSFAFVHALDYSDGFLVEGGTYNPTGYLYYDAEFVLGGPGSGLSTTDESSNLQLSLQYWNGHNYETVNNAFNYGTDTSETIADVTVAGFYYSSDGSVFAQVSEGTEGLGVLWYATDLALVEIDGPGTCDANLNAGSGQIPYLSGLAEIEIGPTTLDLQVACDGYTQDLGEYALSSGTTTVTTLTWATVNFGESGLPSGASWGVSIGSDRESGTGVQRSFYLPVGSYDYTVSGGGGNYLPNPSAGSFSVGTSGTGVSIAWQIVKIQATPSVGSVDVNQVVQLSVPLTGGVDIAGTDWGDLPTGCAVVTTTELSCTPTSSGVYQITASITDSNGFTATSAALSLTVYSDPSQSPPTGSHPSVDVGQAVTFTASVSGGSGGGSYVWSYGSLTGCGASTGSTLTCSPTGSGTFIVSYAWEDSNGYEATGSTTSEFTVYSDPTESPPAASPVSVDVGQSITFTASVNGGAGGGSYVWSYGAAVGCTTSTTSTLTCTPTSAGPLAVSYLWIDANGVEATGSTSLSFAVYPDPTVGMPTPSVPSVDVGGSVTFSATTSPGSGIATYSWTADGLTGCTGLATSTLTCAGQTHAGTYSVTLQVIDSNGYLVTSSSLSFTVYADPTVSSLTASSSSLVEGNSVTFHVSATQGSGDLIYNWSGLPAGCRAEDLATIACTPTSAGSYQIVVKVTDSNGIDAVSSALALTVSPAPPGPPAGEGYELLLGVVLAVGVIGVVISLLLLRRRNDHRRQWTQPLDPAAPAPSSTFGPPGPDAIALETLAGPPSGATAAISEAFSLPVNPDPLARPEVGEPSPSSSAGTEAEAGGDSSRTYPTESDELRLILEEIDNIEREVAPRHRPSDFKKS